MTWTIVALEAALKQDNYCNYSVSHIQNALKLTLKQHGDLVVHISMTSKQIFIETVICPVENIQDVNKLNYRLLRIQKLLPLSSVGISIINHKDYYLAFGALSLASSLADIVLEIETLAENALELAEIIAES
ncbi:DUF2170 family protein [Atlantibacter subterraneus]|uniref:DUF2170 family protein n=1 Tax=Atlantibacter subterraneus TaxID=255519 RepID=UPI00118468B5|nr:DUF2170 family protein [Atlantibacter subterranea]TSJ55549.1 DUF2170 family protein [Atlantibacter subterranea]